GRAGAATLTEVNPPPAAPVENGRSNGTETTMGGESQNVMWFEELARKDVALVGGKNSSLGEMVQRLGESGIRVPPGFATTADAYMAYLAANDLDATISDTLSRMQRGNLTLHEAGTRIR